MVNSEERHNFSQRGQSLYKSPAGKAYVRILDFKRNQEVLKWNYRIWLHNVRLFDGNQNSVEFWRNEFRKGKRWRYQTKLLADTLNYLASARSFGEATTNFSKYHLSSKAQNYATEFAKLKLEKSSNKFLWDLRDALIHQLGKNWVGIKHRRINAGKPVDILEFWMSQDILLSFKNWDKSTTLFLKSLPKDIVLNDFMEIFHRDLLDNVDLIHSLYLIEHMDELDEFQKELNEVLIKIKNIDESSTYPIIESDIRYLRYCKFKLISQ